MKLYKKVLAATISVLSCVTIGYGAVMALTSAGDLNNDGMVKSDDIKIFQKFLLGINSTMPTNADMNGDGKCEIVDLCLMKNAALFPETSSQIKDYGTEMDTKATAIADFRKGKTPLFEASDGWTNGDPFNCGWYSENAVFKDNALNLSIDKDSTGKYQYSGGEYRTKDFYGFGYYETSMQAIKNNGVVSSFFTYTGPSDDNPWDEVDIEVLGKDTTKVQFNYYTNGTGGHEYMYDLGFDASEGYHTYGFDWQKDSITWYVDGKAVYKATNNIPQTPGKIMMNTWPGTGVDDWLKAFDGKTPLTARYQWVTYKKSTQGDSGNNDDNPGTTIKDYGTKMNASATAVADFTKGKTPLFEASAGWTNGDPFNCGWYADNAVFKDNALNLSIDKDSTGKYQYSGGEYRTKDFYGFGYYETSMQAIKNNGVVSSFFTYTGPSDDNPWDEVDIEVLGKDTTKVQFNYYTNGKGGHEYMYDLGFDASEGYHTYGFDWQKDSITWYVDGKAVYKATNNIPQTPGKIMMNTWPGTGVDDWLKAFDGKTPLTARYQWVTYNKTAQSGNNNDDNPGETDTSGLDTTATAIADFRKGVSPLFEASAGWTNGDPFNCGWYANNAVMKDNVLNLTIDRDSTGKYQYSGGEYRTKDFYGFGYYETSMQAIKNSGVVSSFFTYTGPSDNNPWDEVDIEVLGKDTTKVQFNYYTNGKGGHEYMYDLGFDASKGFHRYGFDWQRDSITWYVDGKAVYKATNNIPTTPSKIMMNVWPGTGVDEWLGAFNGNTPLTAKYQWVTYKKK